VTSNPIRLLVLALSNGDDFNACEDRNENNQKFVKIFIFIITLDC
jgi:hypothetical protein